MIDLSGLTAEQQQAANETTYPQLHAELVKSGEFSVLDFWDSIPWLKSGSDWTPWRAFVAALYGLAMTPAELEIYRACTGRKKPPTEKATEAWVPTGRRARKSATVAVIASYEAAFRDHSKYLAPGERGRIPLISKDKDDAQTMKRYVEEIFSGSPLAFLLEGEPTAEEIKLSNRIDFKIRAASLTAGRSKSIPFAALDELAFFRSVDSASPDVDIDRGIQGGMANVPGAMRIGLSSPYAKRGLLYEKFREHYGKEGSSVLVWKAPTLVMHPGNPIITVHVAKAYAADEVSARAEYGAEFRDDVLTFMPEGLVDSVTEKGIDEVRCVPGVQYVAFTDPSGGTSDSMTLAIAHFEPAVGAAPERDVLDLLVEVTAPFEPPGVVGQFVSVLNHYGVRVVEGDHYAGSWPAAEFAKKGRVASRSTGAVYASRADAIQSGIPEADHIQLTPVHYLASEHTKREIYKNFLPLMTSMRVALLDNKRLKAQLEGLDRRTAASGDIIDHPPGGHDDVANVAAGALWRADRMRLMPKKAAAAPPKTTREILVRQFADSLKPKPKRSVNPWNKE